MFTWTKRKAKIKGSISFGIVPSPFWSMIAIINPIEEPQELAVLLEAFLAGLGNIEGRWQARRIV